MAEAEKFTPEKLQHYLAHPEEIDATNTDLVEALARAELPAHLRDSEEGEAGKNEEVDPDAEAAKAAKAEADAKIAADKAAEDARVAEAARVKSGEAAEPGKEGSKIVTPDGKATIPFKVLKDEREGRQAAEGALAEAQQTILSLADRLKAIQAGNADPGAAAAGEKTPSELRAMVGQVREEAPWLADGMEKLVDAVEAAHAKIAEYEDERAESEDDAKARLVAASSEALNNNPTLVLWKTEAPELFEEAVDFDRALRANPRQARQFPTFESRFNRVVDLVKASHQGETLPLPEPIADSSATSAAAKPGAATPSPKEVKARADEALRKAAEAGTSVTTLSDIPGGAGEVGTNESLSRMDVTQVADKFASMTPQQVIDWVMTH